MCSVKNVCVIDGEQPYPWDRLQPQDVMSRHRGAKHRRRYERLGAAGPMSEANAVGRFSLLSPAYLLSVERRPFHTEPQDYGAIATYLCD